MFLSFFFFYVGLGFELQLFFSVNFEDGVMRTLCPGWPQTAILPISASHTAKITGMSLHLQAEMFCLHCDGIYICQNLSI
jgi:hypothetical protein